MQLLLTILALIAATTTTTATATSQIPLAMSPTGSDPSSADSRTDFSRPVHTLPNLFDTLILQRGSSIFFDYVREVPSIHQRTTDPEAKTTLLVPSNKAVIALGWKPERRGVPTTGGKIEISEQSLNANVERWVSGHVLPIRDLDLKTTEPQDTLLDGKPIRLERRGFTEFEDDEEWKAYGIVQGDEFIPLKLKIQASNGVVYLIDQTISVD